MKYFTNPSAGTDVPPREGIAIVFLILYFLLFILMACCYLRLLQVIATNPGYIARKSVRRDRKGHSSQKPEDFPLGAHRAVGTINGAICKSNGPTLDHLGILEGRMKPPAGLEEIYQKDAFICDANGLPIFCNSCWTWKPDRTHHCSELNRCVRRMDHFCPWYV